MVISELTKKTLIYINYNYIPTAYREPRKSISVPAIIRTVNELKKLYKKFKTDL